MTEAQEIARSLFDRYMESGGTRDLLTSMQQARVLVRMSVPAGAVQTDNIAEALVALATRQPLDPHVRAVQRKMTERAAFGLEKYGVTTERKDVDLVGWLAHLQHELLDAVVYIESALDELRPTRKET